MEKTIIEKKWHKVTDKFAMTGDQHKYILSLMDDQNMIGWDFPSISQACRCLTKEDASNIIETLKEGGAVEIV